MYYLTLEHLLQFFLLLKGKKLHLRGEMTPCFILGLLKGLSKHLLQIVQQGDAENIPLVNHWELLSSLIT